MLGHTLNSEPNYYIPRTIVINDFDLVFTLGGFKIAISRNLLKL